MESIERLKELLQKNTYNALEFAEQILSCGEPFAEFSKNTAATSYHGCCGKSWEAVNLSCRCKQCMRGDTSCSCLECFSKTDHTGHDVIISQGTGGVCDCGDIDSMIESAFCCDHKGLLEHPEETLDKEVIERFVPVLNLVAECIAQNYPKTKSQTCLEWMLEISKLGDGYQRLVVNAMIDTKALDAVFEKINENNSRAEEFVEFLTELITDLSLKDYMAKFFVKCSDAFRDSIIELLRGRPSKHEYYQTMNGLAIQVFTKRKIAWQFYIDGGYLINVMNNSMQMIREMVSEARLHRETQKLASAYTCLTQYLGYTLEGLRFRWIARETIYSNLEIRKTIFDSLEMMQEMAKLKRIGSGERQEFDTINMYYAVCCWHLIQGLNDRCLLGFQSVSDREANDEVLPPDVELSKEDEESVLSLLKDLHERYLAYDAKQEKSTNVLTSEFSYVIPLDTVMIGFITTTINKYKIPAEALLKHLEMPTFWMYVKRSLSLHVGINYAHISAFSRNGADPKYAMKTIRRGGDLWNVEPSLFHMLAIYRMHNPVPAAFLDNVLEAWGLKQWLESNGDEIEANTDIASSISLFMRFLVQCMSEYFTTKSYTEKYIATMNIMHMIKTKPMTPTEVTKKLLLDNESAGMYIDCLHEVGVPFELDGERTYKLKPELHDAITPFWIHIGPSDFFEMITPEATKTHELIRLPDPVKGSDAVINKFACAPEFASMLIKMIQIMTSSEDSETYTITAFICLFAVLNMTVEVAKELGDFTAIEEIIKSEVLDKIIPIKALLRPMQTLASIIIDAAANVPLIKTEATNLCTRITEKIREECKPKRGFSRQDVLNAFAKQQSAFTETIQDEDDDEDESPEVPLCVCCKEALDFTAEPCGFMWDSRTIDVCKHYVHHRCCAENPGVCPICMCTRPMFVPIPGTQGVTEEHVTVVCEKPGTGFLSGERGAGVLRQIVRMMCNSMLLNHQQTVKEPVTHLIRVLVETVTLPTMNPCMSIPLVQISSKIAKLGDAEMTEETYRALVSELADLSDYEENLYRVVWNAIAASRGLNIEPLPLIGGDPGERNLLALAKLPRKFGDLFTNLQERQLDVLREAGRGKGKAACICLFCGEWFIDSNDHCRYSMEDHFTSCGHLLYCLISGDEATATMSWSDLGVCSLHPSLYVTEHGDEDRGLWLGKQLFLSDKKILDLRKEFYAGIYHRTTMEQLQDMLYLRNNEAWWLADEEEEEEEEETLDNL